jgi:hypothetical protein
VTKKELRHFIGASVKIIDKVYACSREKERQRETEECFNRRRKQD